MSANGNEEPAGEICHQYGSLVTASILITHNKNSITLYLGIIESVCDLPDSPS